MEALAEVANPTGAILKRYVRGDGADELLVEYDGAGTGSRRWTHSDERGSIVGLSDAAGNQVATNAYDEYGIPGSGNSGRFQYTGQMWLPEVGLYHYKLRAYSPFMGRFMQTDPIGFEGGINLYGYVGNDPVNMVDPLGLEAEECDDREQCPPIVVVGKLLNSFCQDNVRICGMLMSVSLKYSTAATGWGHRYEVETKICDIPLTPAQRGEILRRAAVPGLEGIRLTDGTYLATAFGLPGGFVRSEFSDNGNIVINSTQTPHFFVGQIRRQIYVSNGATYIRTIGSGSAGKSMWGKTRDVVNQASGPVIFGAADVLAAAYADLTIAGC